MITRLFPAALLTALTLAGCAARGGSPAVIDDHADLTTVLGFSRTSRAVVSGSCGM